MYPSVSYILRGHSIELDMNHSYCALVKMVMTENIRQIINMKGVNVGGKRYNNLRYSDDTALLAVNEKELNEVGKQLGLKINIT